MAQKFSSPPPPVPDDILVSFPSPHVLLVTINRPRHLNSLPTTYHAPLDALFNWFDAERALRCAVFTGHGRAFCCGADLKEWNGHNAQRLASAAQDPDTAPARVRAFNAAGFGGISNRIGKKPIVAAVNGLCLGGGMEIALNCDLIVAAEAAKFGLPEVRRGVAAIAGALPRVAKNFTRQQASEMALTGRMFSAAEMERWGLVNRVVPDAAQVVAEAVQVAETIAANSPDAVIVSKEGIRLGWEGIGPTLGTELLVTGLYGQMDGGDNMKEGVLSFVEKRQAVWKNSKL